MIQNKKGMFFTMTAILLLSLALFSFNIFTKIKEREAETQRIETMNNYIFSLEEDLSRKLFISGFRIIFLFEKRILENGTYIQNSNDTFNEAFFNGTINGILRADEEALIEGVQFEDLQTDIEQTASKLNLEVQLTKPTLNVEHQSPWYVTVQLTTNLYIRDKGNLASWNKTLLTEAHIPVEGFEDPLYIINTNGQVFQKINQTPHETFAIGSDVSNLLDHVTNGYYTDTNMSPSFLMRLEGNLNSHEMGIESLVYLPALSLQGITLKDKTVVDNIYFSNNNPTKYNIQGMPPWFKLDDSHLDMYNVSGLTV